MDAGAVAALADLLPWADVGLLGVLAPLVVYGLWAVITGRLIPAATHDRIVAGRDSQITQMQALLDAERARGDLLAGQVSVATEAARTSAQVLDAVRAAAPREGA